ncbi:Latrophilin Cirl [Aphelenchoides fujianensis]|nr:Latrophilin Cirl [Aphelenchoides fujianensis]
MTVGVRWKRPFGLLLAALLAAATAEGPVQMKTIQVCEKEVARLECPQPDEQIAVELANFGRFSRHLCNPTNAVYNSNCPNNATFVVLAHKCNGQQTCEFLVDHTVFGDPCPGTPKYLEAKYSCIHVTTTVAPTTEAPVVEPDDSGFVDVDGGERSRATPDDGASPAAEGCRRTVISDLLNTRAEAGGSTVLRFANNRPKEAIARVECRRWSAVTEGFVADGSCSLLEHNATTTVCRCAGSGDFGVVEIACEEPAFGGWSKKSLLVYGLIALAVLLALLYALWLFCAKKRPKFPSHHHNTIANSSDDEHMNALAKHSGVMGHLYYEQSKLNPYVPRVGGVHDAHQCDHLYATIPPDYSDYYHQSPRYRTYQQLGNQVQRPPVPAIPINGFHRDPTIPVGFAQHGPPSDIHHSPFCSQRDSRAPSLSALRMSNTQLYNNHQCCPPPRPPSDGSYETGRSSSSTSDMTASAASSRTLLLRMDLAKNQPIVYLDDPHSS